MADHDPVSDIGAGGAASVFAIVPVTNFGFGKGEPFSQTRWCFAQEVSKVNGRS